MRKIPLYHLALDFDREIHGCKKGDNDMESRSRNQKNALVNRTKKRCLLLLGFLVIFAIFGIRLVTTESPEEWKEADITVTAVQHVSLKPNCWQIKDIEGNTYSANESEAVMGQILPQNTYHIVYSPNYHNDIRAISHGDTIIVDYAHSISIHSERDIWDLLLALIGLAGSLTTIACMIIDIRKQIIHG